MKLEFTDQWHDTANFHIDKRTKDAVVETMSAEGTNVRVYLTVEQTAFLYRTLGYALGLEPVEPTPPGTKLTR